MRDAPPLTIYCKDYQPYPYAIEHVDLTFDLHPELTRVHNIMQIQRKQQAHDGAELVLNGEELKLLAVLVNGEAWGADRYRLNDQTLSLLGLPARASLEIISQCKPSANSTLMGLYISGGNFFTQCEAEGFRRITWFADRPDVMSRYRVTLRATQDYPVLLSNGNLIATQTLPDGRQEVQWEDPFPKPCYLFALVAGKLTHRETSIKTASGRDVLLQIYSDPGSETKTEWAFESLVRALRWDENRYGLELDLDRFMVVAVHDFNMGAMENKGLNIFNAAYVLANADTATDANYESIESVIGHEYFHNWTGNRVTCRDWFQLSLKEGLTVFRDQEFSADMMAMGMSDAAAASARAVKRIDDVITLRAAQFPEDAGPMAHPIRPDSYQEIGNFYTATVYEKGAEVIRMQHTLLGEIGFRAGMDAYFRRHDGQAVTCDDFVAAMESVYTEQNPGRDFSVFRHWYQQAGTPTVKVTVDYDEANHRCTLTLTQHCEPVGVEKKILGTKAKAPFHIPFAVGLLDPEGRALPLVIAGSAPSDTILLELRSATQQWVFENIPARPVPSLLRDFSAPVIVDYAYSAAELALLSVHDGNPFARWEAGQELTSRQLLKMAAQQQNGQALTVDSEFVQAWKALLTDPALDAAYRARTLSLPAEKTLAEHMGPMDTPALAIAREALRVELGKQLAPQWQTTFDANQTPGAYSPSPVDAGKRALKNLALSHLLAGGYSAAQALAQTQYEHATNMTDRMAALSALVNFGDKDVAAKVLSAFYDTWQHDPLVIDKWFALQASARTTTVDTVNQLMKHPAFTLRNPNRARSLVFQFCMNNPRGVHRTDGAGYDYWAEQVLALDALNPEIAARLARTLDNWSRFVPRLRDPMQAALQRVHQHPGLSRNVFEIVSKTLEFAA